VVVVRHAKHPSQVQEQALAIQQPGTHVQRPEIAVLTVLNHHCKQKRPNV
jgi:hypothetical protein